MGLSRYECHICRRDLGNIDALERHYWDCEAKWRQSIGMDCPQCRRAITIHEKATSSECNRCHAKLVKRDGVWISLGR